MRQTPTLAVDTANLRTNDLNYELEVTPRQSFDSTLTHDIEKQHHEHIPATPSTPQPEQPEISPSIRLLFSLLSRRHVFLLLTPAIFTSIISGGIAPFMTFVVGQAFDAFARFPLTPNPPQEAKDALLRGVGLATLSLVGLAFGSLALGSLTSFLWIWTGEVNVGELRRRVYKGVMSKSMGWFDSSDSSTDNTEGPVGAGGLMAKFTRETDDVRQACSLASGLLIQHLTTTITCLILAFLRSWALTLVILSAVPILMVVQAISQSIANPLLFAERHSISVSATVVERCLTAISTVKAFNAQPFEQSRAQTTFDSMRTHAKKLAGVWGLTSAVAQFVMMGMFVQGFWFGGKLVRDGTVGPGDVMAVFWACLIATSNLQMCIPQMILLTKGKFSMAALMNLVQESGPDSPSSPSAAVPVSPATTLTFSAFNKPPRNLRKITPTKCYGELALHNVSFAYPTRSEQKVLKDVSLYLPARETTFIVGASGSGKSSIAQLLLRMYDASHGYVSLDEQDMAYLDETWVRSKVMGVTQSTCVILEGRTVFENVACAVGNGRRPTPLEVEEACRAALIHDFIRDLPEGYDTVLGGGGGGGGVSLSGGQRQRLAFARAKIRNPEVLILDEATSALDPTSRILVFEAMKVWRKNKTTIVITHDLSQITSEDFVYVVKGGSIVEQGYRSDLEVVGEADELAGIVEVGADDAGKGEFRKMMQAQQLTGGCLPEKELDDEDLEELDIEVEEEEVDFNEKKDRSAVMKHQSLIRPLTLGNWMFDVVAELVAPPPAAVPTHNNNNNNRESGLFAPTWTSYYHEQQYSRQIPSRSDLSPVPERQRRPSSAMIESPTSPAQKSLTLSPEQRRLSLQFVPTTPSSATFTLASGAWGARKSMAFDAKSPRDTFYGRESVVLEEDEKFEEEKEVIKKSGGAARTGRNNKGMQRRQHEVETVDVVVDKEKNSAPRGLFRRRRQQPQKAGEGEEAQEEQPPAFWALMRVVYPTIPNKPLLFLGFAICILSGGMTPVFSFLLARLLFEVSIGAQNVKIINIFGGVVLGVAALDGLLLGLKYFIMEVCGVTWVTRLRSLAFGNLLKQDLKFFDKRPQHGPAKLVQVVVKDAEDSRNLVAVVMGQCLVVVTMLGVGLTWAMVRGWELTLVGVAVAPVFAVIMSVQTTLVGKCEVRNKRAREALAKAYYEGIINVRGIRAMSFEKEFEKDFEDGVGLALRTGVRGAFVEGCTYGVASGLIYLAEALLFYVGAVLMVKGRYSYLQMVEVLNLVVFTVSIGSQLMAFTERIAKSVQATADLNTLVSLSAPENGPTAESKGFLKPLPLEGSVTLSNVHFAYPSRPEAPVLNGVNLEIQEGECVALVGPSGCGKSTIAALMQRLYEPQTGNVLVGGWNVSDIDVSHLRENISVVNQHPNLFDASVADNIRYGAPGITQEDVEAAARKANVHDFVMGLPNGYETVLGENASLVSGGQAQRIQIARALVRRGTKVLILDECTSALDAENQAAVMETIRNLVKQNSMEERGMTTVMVTHKLQVMQMCDRIVVLGEGEVKEQGTYEQLVRRKGVFASLAAGGEWIAD